MLERLKSSWPWALALLFTAVGAFSAGRFSAPEQVREVERWKTLDLTTEDVTKGMTFAKTVDRTVWRNVVTTTTDAGTVVVDRSVEHEGSTTNSTETSSSRTSEEHAGELAREKTTTLQADWRIGVQVGASLVAPKLPITGPLVIGASIERRIIGGVSAGLWANTVGAGGASVSVEF